MADDALTKKEAEMGRLLPCPFCGGTKIDVYHGLQRASCDACGGNVSLKYWNSRALSLESVREEALLLEIGETCVAAASDKQAVQHILKILERHGLPNQHAPARVAEGGADTKLPQVPKASPIRRAMIEALTTGKQTTMNPEETKELAEVMHSAVYGLQNDNLPADWFRWWLPHAAEETGLSPKRIMEGLASCRYENAPTPAPESPAKEQPGEQRISSRTLAEWAVKAAKEPGTWEQKARDFLRSQQPPPPERP